MIVYRVDWYDQEAGHCLAWEESPEDAERRLREFQEGSDDGYPIGEGITRVRLPHTKSGMVRWLNTNHHTDNG